jgi:hypothetical protein
MYRLLLYLPITFFLKRRGPEGPRASLTYHSGGSTNYIKGPEEKRNYKSTQAFCTKDLILKKGNAIQASSRSTAVEVAGANLHATGDRTTWGMEAGANSDDAIEPPSR